MNATHAKRSLADHDRLADAQLGATAGAATRVQQPSRKALWAGRVMSGFASLFLLFDATLKVLELPASIEGSGQLGYPQSVVFGLGLVQAACLVLYLVPRTAVLGAVLWTAYLGGAVATHVRVGSPLFSHTLFPIYVAVLLWGGLWLRDLRLRELLPLRVRT
jgi:hypothetical protein